MRPYRARSPNLFPLDALQDRHSQAAMWDRMWDRLASACRTPASAPPVGCLRAATNRRELASEAFQRIGCSRRDIPRCAPFAPRTSNRRVTTPVFFSLVRSAKATDSATPQI
jgi:hypothetical protein